VTAAKRHSIRGGDGKFARSDRGKHVQSSYAAAQVQPTDGFRPHQDAQVTEQASVPVVPTGYEYLTDTC
jgi:hypothetical protein